MLSDELEQPVVFPCQGRQLVGIIHAAPNAQIGLVMVSGGDQYRVGSHRLFVELARVLADAGVAVMRFDHRGVGDTAGQYHGFQNLNEDIAAAIKEFRRNCPTVNRLVLGGLCDGASAALIATQKIKEINELVLINPWVHTSDLEARTRLLNYYGSRLRSREFWKKLLRGQIQINESWQSLIGYLKMFFQSLFSFGHMPSGSQDYVTQMRRGISDFDGRIYIILAGQDLVAQQFQHLATIDKNWKEVLGKPRVSITKLPGADHTFSISGERRKFEEIMLDWFTDRNELR